MVTNLNGIHCEDKRIDELDCLIKVFVIVLIGMPLMLLRRRAIYTWAGAKSHITTTSLLPR